jgi:hypothetical protein
MISFLIVKVKKKDKITTISGGFVFWYVLYSQKNKTAKKLQIVKCFRSITLKTTE